METRQILSYFVANEQQGKYLTLPFTMPAGSGSFTLSYQYERHQESPSGSFLSRQEINIIDLGLIAPDGSQVGASGSDKRSIEISATSATPGYHAHALDAGEWQILLGAYKVAPQGVTVTYELSFTPKEMRWFKGDLHTHTVGSDGVLTAQELGQHALRQGLDFLAVTDHNQMVSQDSLPRIPGLTMIPGVEWTHYKGHANFLGVDCPYDEPFHANDPAEVQRRFQSARERGALISINHPYDEQCPFKFDLEALPYDCLEIWNGPMRVANLQALGFWHSLLAAGKKIPIVGGSDYHRDHLFLFVGGPTTCVRAASASGADLLAALRQGHSYITFAPYGPSVELTAGAATMGDSVPFAQEQELQIRADGLLAGDVLQVTTAAGSTPLLKAETDGSFRGSHVVTAAGFARVEVLRSFIPGLPPLPALVSNPVYFENK